MERGKIVKDVEDIYIYWTRDEKREDIYKSRVGGNMVCGCRRHLKGERCQLLWFLNGKKDVPLKISWWIGLEATVHRILCKSIVLELPLGVYSCRMVVVVVVVSVYMCKT